MNDEIKEILDFKENADYKKLSCDEIKVLRDYITNLQKENENYKSRLEKQNESVHQRKPQTKNHHLVFSEFWNCKKSPTGYCVYDLDSDLGYDDCIFCHEPDERK